MKQVILIVLISLLGSSLISCQEDDVAAGTPACIEDAIRKIKGEEPRNPPAEVWKLTVEKATYYYIPPDCCDQFSELYDLNCNLVCSPDGGLTGQGSGNCPPLENAERELIWQDDRE